VAWDFAAGETWSSGSCPGNRSSVPVETNVSHTRAPFTEGEDSTVSALSYTDRSPTRRGAASDPGREAKAPRIPNSVACQQNFVGSAICGPTPSLAVRTERVPDPSESLVGPRPTPFSIIPREFVTRDRAAQDVAILNPDANTPLTAMTLCGILPVGVISRPYGSSFSYNAECIHAAILAAHPERELVAGCNFAPMMGNRPGLYGGCIVKRTENPIHLGIRLEDPVGHVCASPFPVPATTPSGSRSMAAEAA
jgi:hypothetical protein